MQYTFYSQYVVYNQIDQDGVSTSIILDQSQEISSPKLMNSRGRDVIGGIQPRFMYQFAFKIYYELMEDWEVVESININVVENIEGNYLWII